MSAMGTDLLAVACILGGAAVSGGATLAAVRHTERPSCAVEAIAVPRVTVRMGSGDRDVVVRPHVVRIRRGGMHGCASVVVDGGVQVRLDRVRMDEVRARVEEARLRADMARMRADQARVRAEQLRVRATTVPADQLQGRLREEIARLQEELARLDGGAGGR